MHACEASWPLRCPCKQSRLCMLATFVSLGNEFARHATSLTLDANSPGLQLCPTTNGEFARVACENSSIFARSQRLNTTSRFARSHSHRVIPTCRHGRLVWSCKYFCSTYIPKIKTTEQCTLNWVILKKNKFHKIQGIGPSITLNPSYCDMFQGTHISRQNV
jgi:hypothetical protein